MAITPVNLSYIGYGGLPAGSSAVGQGQTAAGQDSGPLAKTLVGTGVVTLDGAATSFGLNFIDGVQKLSQNTILLPLQSAAAPVTINGVANQAIYSGVGSFGQLAVGTSVVIAGFTNAGNNGTFTVNAVTASSITVTNASSVAETNYAATLTFTKGPSVVAVDVSRSATADTAAAGIGIVGASAITNVGCTVHLSAAGAAAATMGLIAVIYFGS